MTKKKIYHEKTGLGSIDIYVRDRLFMGFAVGVLGLTLMTIWVIVGIVTGG